jgi:hypothetical protein
VRKRTAIVPRVVFTTLCVGVVPACAIASCGGDDSSGKYDSGPLLGVACFDCGAGVAEEAFGHDADARAGDAGDAGDAPGDSPDEARDGAGGG